MIRNFLKRTKEAIFAGRLITRLSYPEQNSDAGYYMPIDESKGASISTTIALSVLTLLLGVVGGILASVSQNAQWKGEVENRLKVLERERMEDRQEFRDRYDYIRTQNEVNGKALSRIETVLERGRVNVRR